MLFTSLLLLSQAQNRLCKNLALVCFGARSAGSRSDQRPQRSETSAAVVGRGQRASPQQTISHRNHAAQQRGVGAVSRLQLLCARLSVLSCALPPSEAQVLFTQLQCRRRIEALLRARCHSQWESAIANFKFELASKYFALSRANPCSTPSDGCAACQI